MSSVAGGLLLVPGFISSLPESGANGACLSLGTVPFPAKLVVKVRSGAYVEMKELLGNNIALLSEVEIFNGLHHFMGIPGANKPHLREVSSLSSWIYYFLAYLALCCMDKETREHLVYAQLIVRETLHQGGKGWLIYDKVFH